MNPLSPFLYYRRHKAWALALTALLALAAAAVYLVIGLLQETFVTPIYTINAYLEKFSVVQSETAEAPEPFLAERIRSNPDVTQVLGQSNLEIVVPGVGGASFPIRLIGLAAADIPFVLDRAGVTLTEGELPRAGTNGVAVSREVAMALELELGDTFDRTTDGIAFAVVGIPLKLVGILSGDVRLGVMSLEFLAGEPAFQGAARSGWLVFARPGREAAVDVYLQKKSTGGAAVFTLQKMREKTAKDSIVLYTTGIPLVLLITLAITLVVGSINQLAFLRRLPEFGALHAVGRSRGWLARRLTAETAVLAAAGTAAGIALACAAMGALSAALFEPEGFGFSPLQIIEMLFVVPLPLAVIGFTLFSALRAFAKLDPVAIVERGELSMEEERIGRAPAGTIPRPLGAVTFFVRHKRRAAALIGATALMIMGAALFMFVVEMFDDARQPLLNHLREVSLVSPVSESLPALPPEDLRALPAVERVIPVRVFSALGIAIPPVTPNYPGETYAVSHADLEYMVDLFGLELAEGRLPLAGTNELAIPWTFARNRNLHIGDTVGDSAHPLYRDAPVLPSVLVISGIFAPAGGYAEENWLSFASLEYIEENPKWRLPQALAVTARPGQKAALDSYLEGIGNSEAIQVFTYGNQTALFKEQAAGLKTILGLLEGIIALVAALTLAGLTYIFYSGRRTEFGVMYALGIGRRRLIWRGLRESLFTTIAAWLAAVLIFAAAVLVYQRLVYDPAGLQLRFFSPTPWLFTLPVPLAVILAGGIALAVMLSRMDAVEIIERR